MSTECRGIDLKELLQQALDMVISARLTEMEQARVKLCLQHPTVELKEQQAAWCDAIADVLATATASMLNGMLYPGD